MLRKASDFTGREVGEPGALRAESSPSVVPQTLGCLSRIAANVASEWGRGSGRERVGACHAKMAKTRRGRRRPLLLASFLRMFVGGRGVFVGSLAMFLRGACVLLGFFVLTQGVVMLRLMMMMRSGVVVSGRLVMMLASRMLR
jgi:hypothetical protein